MKAQALDLRSLGFHAVIELQPPLDRIIDIN